MHATGIGVVLDTRSKAAERKVQEISEEIAKIEKDSIRPEAKVQSSTFLASDYLPSFDGFFQSKSKSVGTQPTTVELKTVQAQMPALYHCKHCQCSGSFVEVANIGPVHSNSCRRYNPVSLPGGSHLFYLRKGNVF